MGFDPTAPSIHMGNLVQIMLVRQLQAAGHRPFLLVGGSTGLIGDPKEAGERVMNPVELVHEWVEKIRVQVSRFVDFDGSAAATVVNNYDWTAGMVVVPPDVGKHFSVNRMLDREVRSSLTRASATGVQPLLQSLDLRERTAGTVTMQTGGSDQWGNLTAGVDPIRRSEGGCTRWPRRC